ncbi:MAG TPA: hypothetical protein VNO32_22950, partial [Candidatus Acidoferrum sp.]|nr:hypothetical protein [Candidatus Acidoferrum sp.]
METKQDLLGARGLILPRPVLRRLDQLGIYARPAVSLEYQTLAKRYVLRGIESGGAIANLGRYVTFAAENGEPLNYLLPVDTLGVNGLHAVVVAPVLTRVEFFRVRRSCQILITIHRTGDAGTGKRPPLVSKILFRAMDGVLHDDVLREQLNLTD